MGDAHPSAAARARSWLERTGRPVATVEPIVGDVSPRQYSRVRLLDGTTAIVAFYPDAVRDGLERFAISTQLLSDAGVRVPAVWGRDDVAGWMLVEDLGAETLFDRVADWPERARYYPQALDQIDRIQTVPAERVANLNPALDRSLLRFELRQTQECFFCARLGLEEDAFDEALDDLCVNLAAGGLVVCHRDFMVRNLVPLDPKEGSGALLGVLDHQDLRLGPRFYDLASLLNDSLFAPVALENQCLAGRVTTAAELLAYRRAVAQRTLKALGTFARCATQGSAKHEALIPATFDRACTALGEIPEGRVLAQALVESSRE